jgi:hypothetical protein
MLGVSILPLILLYFGTVPKVWKCFVFQFIPLKFLEYQILLYHRKMYSDFFLTYVIVFILESDDEIHFIKYFVGLAY